MSKEWIALFDEFKRDFRAELKEFKDSFDRDFRKQMHDIKASLAQINSNQKELVAENRLLKETNARLQTRCSDLSQQVKEQEGRLVQLEQHSRVANLEITGVPFCKGEDLTEVIAGIGEAIQEPVTPADIEVAHQVPTAKSPTVKNIVVQFASRKKRDVFLEKARPVRLTSSDLGFDSQAPVFINEHLCAPLKRLLGQAIARKREVNWNYVWVRNGKIFARHSEGHLASRLFAVRTLPQCRCMRELMHVKGYFLESLSFLERR
ncbi:hypothetical protein HPB48_026206 [Haemaphysalis longicornis]|uniref:FP protein C-terminal domain-containing protein n=1 Tax=Haemaphysalis longicornis TaxID=44386 RepID=A0A9J6HBT5_HAELO|nr:hypothetical protein HPB48_026206 [Haemaphysalis longicornis]